jgi:hypothetical protein
MSNSFVLFFLYVLHFLGRLSTCDASAFLTTLRFYQRIVCPGDRHGGCQEEVIVVIDTLPFPVETSEMIEYLKALGRGRSNIWLILTGMATIPMATIYSMIPLS